MGVAPLDDVGAELAEIRSFLLRGTGVRVLARIDGRPVGTGGCTVADGFVRLWSAATVPDARGSGVYRAVLARRLRYGAELGATTALVKAHRTSAPILLRCGFHAYGTEREYTIEPVIAT